MPGHRLFAAVYDKALEASEEAGLRAMRVDLLGQASGRTLEVGAGTGVNLEHYPEAVTELVLTEPDTHMAKRLRRKLEADPPAVGSVRLLETGIETLPFDAGSFDTVVSTLVLCTVPDPELAMAELRRVLKPGGRLIYMEHVRDGHGSRRGRVQDLLERPWGFFLGGCHPNRDTGRMIRDEFGVPEPEPGEMPGDDPATWVVKPLISGVARRQA